MAETILPSIPGIAQIQAVGVGSATQSATQAPAEFAGLPIGSFIKGFVINRDRANNPILRTDQGDVLVRSDVFLKTGSEVTIRIEQIASHWRARIITVDDMPIKDVVEQQLQHMPPKDDVVLQPSIVSRTPAAVATLTEDGLVPAPIILEAVMLKTPGESKQETQILSAIFKLPMPEIQKIVEGGPLQFRVVSAEINLAPASITPAPAPVHASPMLPIIAAENALPSATVPPPVVQSSPLPLTPAQLAKYQSYGQQTTIHTASQPVVSLSDLTPPATISAAAMASPLSKSTQPVTPTPIPLLMPTANTMPLPKEVQQILPQQMAAPRIPALPQSTITPITTPVITADDITAPLLTSSANPLPPVVSPGIPVTDAYHGVTVAPGQSRPNTMTARVIATESSGETIVRTPAGMFKLFTAAPPPPGSTLQLELIVPQIAHGNTQELVATTISSTLTPMQTFQSLSHNWYGLQQALAAMSAGHAEMDFAHRIPNTRSGWVNNALFFLSALKSGNLRDWLGGRAADALEDRSPDLFSRLSNEFSGLRTVAYDQRDQPWQYFLLPMLHEEELHQTRLYVRQEEKNEKKGGSGAATRFMVEVTLSEIGDMQFDGLVRKQDRQTLFDLIIRSEADLDDEIQREMTAIYTQGAQMIQYAGQIKFQANREHFVSPMQSAPQAYNSDGRSIIA